jgi:hypothetical protein
LLDNYATVPTSENVLSIYADASRGYIQSYNNGYKDIAICPSGGNLLVGVTSATEKFEVNGSINSIGQSIGFGAGAQRAFMDYTSGTTTARIGHLSGASGSTTGVLAFFTNNSERARIDSAGNLLVGDTTVTGGAEKVRIKSAGATSATAGISIANSAGTELFFIRSDGAFRTGSAAASPYNNTVGEAANCYINTDGTLLRSTSSLKYKRDVQDATHGLAEVLQLRPVTYKGKGESDGETVFGGLIAEEVHATGLTEFVQYAEDGSPDALAYGNMASLMVKAIQEQQAIIEQLQADVATLKGAA